MGQRVSALVAIEQRSLGRLCYPLLKPIMRSDVPRPAGDEPADSPQPKVVVEAGRANIDRGHASVLAASKFVGRVSLLDADALRTVVAIWHDVMRADSDVWFAAERVTAETIVKARRAAEQEMLIGGLSDHFLRRVWYRSVPGHEARTPERRVGATEATGQYVATLAMLALLVRDHLTQADFDVLYRPFAQIIRAEDLVRE